MSTKVSDYYDSHYNIAKMYQDKFAKMDQKDIGDDATCDRCGEPVKITDFRSADDFEFYCCGSGNDEAFCQRCQDEI